MAVLMALVFTSVFFRYVLSDPIIATEDMMAILLGVMIFTAVPSVTLSRGHISVELLTAPFKPYPLADRIRLVCIDIGVVAMTLYIAWLLYNQATRYLDRETSSLVMEWPLFPYVFAFSFLLVIGACLFAWRAFKDRGTATEKSGISL
jgi:TRAP-type C4-dicarboxylate transport system permease small subunit